MDSLFIGVKDMAVSMGVSEKTIYRMLNDNRFPFAVKIGGQWRFRAESVEKWLTAQSGTGAESAQPPVNYGITLFEALMNGSVLYRIHGINRDEALDELLSSMPNTGGFNADNCKFSILDREALVPSSLAGMACMTPSDEHPIFVERSLIILAYLEQPVDFKALDGIPASLVFLILPANSQEKAILRTRLHRLMMEPEFIEEIMLELPRKEMLEFIKSSEDLLLFHPAAKIKKQKSTTANSAGVRR